MLRRTKTRLPFNCNKHYRTVQLKFHVELKNADAVGAIIDGARNYPTFPSFYSWQPNANCLTS